MLDRFYYEKEFSLPFDILYSTTTTCSSVFNTGFNNAVVCLTPRVLYYSNVNSGEAQTHESACYVYVYLHEKRIL